MALSFCIFRQELFMLVTPILIIITDNTENTISVFEYSDSLFVIIDKNDLWQKKKKKPTENEDYSKRKFLSFYHGVVELCSMFLF